MNIHINYNQTEATINGVEYLLTPKETTVSKPEAYTIEQLKTEKIAVRCENNIQSGTFSTELGLIGLACYPIRVFWNSHLLRWDWILFNGNTVRHNFTKTIPFSQVQFPEKRDWEVTGLKAKDGTIVKYKDGICYERNDTVLPENSVELDVAMGYDSVSIHSVLRSDGVEFTVGEEVEVNGHNGKIVKFERAFHNESKMNVCLSGYINDEDSWFNITELSKHKPSKKVLFKTEDGVEVFDLDTQLYACKIGGWEIINKKAKSVGGYGKMWKWFSTRGNALQYISDNSDYLPTRNQAKTSTMIQLEKQVCTLSQALKLKELGVKQSSILKWEYRIEPHKFWSVELCVPESWAQVQDRCSAFTCAEIGVMLPDYTESHRGAMKDYYCGNVEDDDGFAWFGMEKTESAARAAYLIHLLESKLITVEEINSKL